MKRVCRRRREVGAGIRRRCATRSGGRSEARSFTERGGIACRPVHPRDDLARCVCAGLRGGGLVNVQAQASFDAAWRPACSWPLLSEGILAERMTEAYARRMTNSFTVRGTFMGRRVEISWTPDGGFD